jgi:Integrase core domain
MGVRQRSKHELAAAIQARYLKAPKVGRGRILDEFVAATGYHRRHAVRLLRHGRFGAPALAAVQGVPAASAPGPRAAGRGGRPRVYGARVLGALRTVAEASDWLCGKRLAPFLPELVPALEAEGALRLTPAERVLLVGLSAATIDRRRRPFRLRRRGPGWGPTKPGTLLKQQVPGRTYTPWADQRPGFLEIDLVAHGGTTTEGFYLNTLVATDVCTGWTECAGVWGKSQRAVFAALEAIRARRPFPLLGLDSDNGGEFLNAPLVRFCATHRITFTRSRPYGKNDQAHVEQKHWSVVRRLLGYGRSETREALVALDAVYADLRLWTNFWQPSLKLIAKVRDAATGKARKTYDAAQTPHRRLLASGVVAPDQQRTLAETFAAVGPVALRRRLAAAVERLTRLQKRPNDDLVLASAG